MKKKLIEKLKAKQKDWTWSEKEVQALKQLKYAGIRARTIFSDAETMKELFPTRTKAALERKYDRI